MGGFQISCYAISVSLVCLCRTGYGGMYLSIQSSGEGTGLGDPGQLDCLQTQAAATEDLL